MEHKNLTEELEHSLNKFSTKIEDSDNLKRTHSAKSISDDWDRLKAAQLKEFDIDELKPQINNFLFTIMPCKMTLFELENIAMKIFDVITESETVKSSY